ncbi:hypothetical protein RB213_008492 [Colletotrichum asianum]
MGGRETALSLGSKKEHHHCASCGTRLDPHHIIFSGGEMLHKSAYMLRTYTTNEPGHGQSHHAATVLPTYSTTTTWRIMVPPRRH